MNSPRTVSKLARRALDVAAEELAAGVHETPPGSNRGPRIDEYSRARGADLGQRWCAAFVCFCITEAARRLGLPDPIPLKDWGDLMSAWKWMEAAKARGIWTPDPYPGMVGVIYAEDQHHVVLVKDYGCEWVTSIDGNHEEKVAEVERHVSRFAGFVDWSGERPAPECLRPPELRPVP